MERANYKAHQMMCSYFGDRGQTNPDDYATGLLDCIHVFNNKPAISDKHFEVGVSILRSAHFDVDDLAENHLNITLHIEPLHALDAEAGSQVFGCARPKAREITICERTLQYDPLYRATVMHETGHIVLHGSGKETFNYSPNSAHRPAYEKEADQFMVETLLPDSVLLLAILFCAHFKRINVLDAIRIANCQGKGFFQWKYIFLPCITKWLGVSRQMISIKLLHLGFFSRETLHHHCPDLRNVSGNQIETTSSPLSKSMQGIAEKACLRAKVLVRK